MLPAGKAGSLFLQKKYRSVPEQFQRNLQEKYNGGSGYSHILPGSYKYPLQHFIKLRVVDAEWFRLLKKIFGYHGKTFHGAGGAVGINIRFAAPYLFHR